MKKLSYSAWKRYMICPKSFDYHYNERLRPTGKSSALAFGSAVDEALNQLLLSNADPVKVFRDIFNWEDTRDLDFDDRDYDELLVGDTEFSSPEQASWASLRVKGRILLEAYVKEIYPLIEEVESVQQTLPNRPGVIDAILKLKGFGRVLIDHKTAIRPYNPSALNDDTQLALYANSINIQQIGYIVLVKTIPKIKVCTKCNFNGTHVRHRTCPQTVDGTRCRGTWKQSIREEGLIQTIIGEAPKINQELITSSISEVERAVDKEIFPRNLGACGKIYGKPCPYINKCWKNSNDGLIITPERKKK